MTRPIRSFSSPRPTTVETLQTCFQHRSLLRPGPRLNRRLVGVVAKARQLYGVELHGFVALSSHLHILATYEDPAQMAAFHCFLNANLSKEVGFLRDWAGSVFPERYRHVELSEEPAVERSRLKYLLAQGCKEGLVASPLDWPGASSTWALVGGERLVGEWLDRTALRRARQRGEDVSEADFIEPVEVELSPLRSLTHLSPEAYRREMRVLVREIEEETAAMHRVDGTRPLGVDGILARDPHFRPSEVPRRPRPWFHGLDPAVRERMRRALVTIAAYYRAAAEALKGGDRKARFPVHTFPPGLPFVRGGEGLVIDGTCLAPSQDVELLEPG